MNDNVQIALIISGTIIASVWMVRATVHRLACATRQDFTFAIKLPFNTGMWLFRGSHKPQEEILPLESLKKTGRSTELPTKQDP